MRQNGLREIGQLYGGIVGQRRVSGRGLPSDHSAAQCLNRSLFHARHFADRKAQLERVRGRWPLFASPHHRTGRYQLTESFLVSERVPGPTERSLAAAGRRMPEDQVAGFRLGLGHDALFQADAVGKRWTSHGPVKPWRRDGNEENSHREDYSEPERGCAHDVDRCAEVRVVKQLRVERKCEAEVEEDAAPDDKVIETSPVGRVQGTLHTSQSESLTTA